ncbi:CAAX prenyl protease-like protein [Motilibacter peucedani]|uniref:CAAX prenyl protease-like protein n=1 Tax=Motilibacter peucedani TaxID=598650 RepID=A0A420XQC9_9ACTN|nr:CPBP family intramembrane glutamic endopeptidase [Motilibacter peucedani]RKS75455.1 CAAX prenyl protease-like protein [Motilibacter peucedani]
MQLETAPQRRARTLLRDEVLLVLGVSLGASAVFALVSFLGTVTAPGGLASHRATLNGTLAPGRPWLDLARQSVNIAAGIVPAFLALHLLTRDRSADDSGSAANSDVGRSGAETLGLDRRRWRHDLALGAALAAAIGGSGLALYLGARAAGANLTVVPTTLPAVWWRVPVLLLSAFQNAFLEEVVVVGYLLRRLDQLGWSPRAALLGSSLLRGSYHLYQGLGGLAGNAVMGVVFVTVYRRYGRVAPLVVAHTLIDSVAFVGYALLAGKVGWLPT